MVPNSEEIAKLPGWARVAFAARCARRVLPIYSAWARSNNMARQLANVERAVSSAENTAADWHVYFFADTYAVSARAFANAIAKTTTDSITVASAAMAARAAATVAATTAMNIAKILDPVTADTVHRAVSEVICADPDDNDAIAASIAREVATIVRDRSGTLRAAADSVRYTCNAVRAAFLADTEIDFGSDFETLTTWCSQTSADDFTLVPPTVFNR